MIFELLLLGVRRLFEGLFNAIPDFPNFAPIVEARTDIDAVLAIVFTFPSLLFGVWWSGIILIGVWWLGIRLLLLPYRLVKKLLLG